MSSKSPEIEEIKKYHPNGELWEHCFTKNNLLHGEYKSFYDNANPYEHYFYKDGEYHGEYKWFRDDGVLEDHCFFNNDNREELSDYIDDINNITDSEFMNLSMIFGNSFSVTTPSTETPL